MVLLELFLLLFDIKETKKDFSKLKTWICAAALNPQPQPWIYVALSPSHICFTRGRIFHLGKTMHLYMKFTRKSFSKSAWPDKRMLWNILNHKTCDDVGRKKVLKRDFTEWEKNKRKSDKKEMNSGIASKRNTSQQHCNSWMQLRCLFDAVQMTQNWKTMRVEGQGTNYKTSQNIRAARRSNQDFTAFAAKKLRHCALTRHSLSP